MQTFAKGLNAKSSQADMAFYAVACRAEKTSWPSTIVAMISTGKAFVFGCAHAFTGYSKRLLADCAGVGLQNQKRGILLRGHTCSPSADVGIMSGKTFWIGLKVSPHTFAALTTILCIVGFASSYLLWGVVVGSTALFDIGTTVIFPTAKQFFLFVFVIVLLHAGLIFRPLFGSAIVFSHVANPQAIRLGSMGYTTPQLKGLIQ